SSELHIAEDWYPTTALEDLLGIATERIDDHRLYRTRGYSRDHRPDCKQVCIALVRSEEHTSELQSRVDLVCRLLLEKKKHTSELQSRVEIVSRLLLENKN